MTSKGDEFRGKTVDEAIETGLAALGLKPGQAEIEILSRGSRGLLGFGAEDARVRITRVTVAKPEMPAAPPAAAPKPAPVAKPPVAPPAPVAKPVTATPEPEHVQAKPAKAAAASDGDEDLGATAAELLQGMLDRMDVRATVQVVPYRGVLDAGQEAPLVLNIEGEDLGILIGRRAETLSALEYLTRLMVNHRTHRWVNLMVDVESYKARREEQLVKLAERMAERAISTGRSVSLEAMPPRERRIVHIALRNMPNVTTQSVGEGDQRKVTIIPQ
ncbi:MAG: RNA-binding cell elongation regulator Jag/EloR [Anaerolineae bacterium]